MFSNHPSITKNVLSHTLYKKGKTGYAPLESNSPRHKFSLSLLLTLWDEEEHTVYIFHHYGNFAIYLTRAKTWSKLLGCTKNLNAGTYVGVNRYALNAMNANNT